LVLKTRQRLNLEQRSRLQLRLGQNERGVCLSGPGTTV